MSISKKNFDFSKYGLANFQKKIGVNFLRYVFSAVNKENSTEERFFIELEFLNPHIKPNEVVLGFEPRVNVSSGDLQSALLGNIAQSDFKGEDIETPSYGVIRFGCLSGNHSVLCHYFPCNQAKISTKPTKIEIENTVFSDKSISGEINLSESEVSNHPELFSNSGKASWNLTYEIDASSIKGYNKKNEKWLPLGIVSSFYGLIKFNDVEYAVLPQKSKGYIERFYLKDLPSTWFHLSSCDFVSLISGKKLHNFGFSIQGIFNNKLSVICNLGDDSFAFSANQSDRKYTVVCDCSQTPENESEKETMLHWSISLSSNDLILDVDIFSNLKDLSNRSLELSEGNRALLNLVQSGYGTGEFKLYKKVKKSIEQIEYAKIESAFCEFGKREIQ